MTKNNLVTVSEDISMDNAQKLLHKHRIEKLLVVDKNFKCEVIEKPFFDPKKIITSKLLK